MKIGYIGLTKASWKTPRISALMSAALESLRKLSAEIIHAPDLTVTEAEAAALAEKFKHEGADLIVMHFATFPLGAMIPAVAAGTDAPIILFANPEKPAPGGVWEQNSFCGANMAAHVLNKLGKKYSFAWGRPEDAAEVIASAVKTQGCVKFLAGARVGVAGGRAPGFYTSNFDELRLRSALGVTAEIIDLLEIVHAAEKISGADAESARARLRKSAADVRDVAGGEISLAGNLLEAFLETVKKYSLDALAVRCWPEFSDIFGVAPCASIGALNDSGVAAACEGDALGSVTMLIQKYLASGPAPFFADLISFDYDANTGLLWHCGAAPASLCRNFKETTLRRHMRVDGGDKKGVTNDFPLRPGRITLAKLDEGKDSYRMLIAAGTALDTEPFIRGNPLNVRFDGDMRELVDTVMRKGFEHHYCAVHADIKKELLSFCETKNIESVIIE
jgi:L-fucose isomerase-like protein